MLGPVGGVDARTLTALQLTPLQRLAVAGVQAAVAGQAARLSALDAYLPARDVAAAGTYNRSGRLDTIPAESLTATPAALAVRRFNAALTPREVARAYGF